MNQIKYKMALPETLAQSESHTQFNYSIYLAIASDIDLTRDRTRVCHPGRK